MSGNDEPGDTGKLKVFISYSRKDVDFADDLELFLETRGFDPVIDRHDIDHNDEWQPRLYELIHGCDVVVFVLTETSAGSSICAWEVAEAARLGKRRLVVTPGPLASGTKPPEGLSAANWIHCWRNPAVPDSSTANGKKELERALKTDVGWLRERTRLMEQAAAWLARGGATDSPLLLRGDVLTDAQAWARKAPKDETLPDAVARLLGSSETNEARIRAETEARLAEKQAAVEAAARSSRRVRSVSMIGGAVAGMLLVAAAVAGWFAWTGFQEVGRQRAELARAQNSLAASQLEVETQRAQVARAQSDLVNSRNEAKRQEEAAAVFRLNANAQIASSLSSDYEGLRPRCQLLTEGLFPFFQNGSIGSASFTDSTSLEYLTGVQRMFGVDGELTWLKKKVNPYLDVSGRIWRWKKVDGVTDQFDADSAVQLQKATRISEYLTSGLDLKFEAIQFGSNITSAELVFGEQVVHLKAGEVTPTSVKWTAVPVDVSLTLYSGASQKVQMKFPGPWGLFELMRRARLEQAGPSAVNATFGQGSNAVTAKVVYSTVENPFGVASSPWTFRCPRKL